jgi:hypothetical protein
MFLIRKERICVNIIWLMNKNVFSKKREATSETLMVAARDLNSNEVSVERGIENENVKKSGDVQRFFN